MRRRKYIAIAGASIAGVSGCSASSEEMEGGDHSTQASGSNGGSDGTPATAEPTNTPTMTPKSTATPTSTPESTARVAIKDSKLKTRETSYQTEAFVVARIVNEGQGLSGAVRVKARFYDEDDNLLDDITGSLPYMKPGETWEAHLPYLDDGSKVKSHKIDGEFETEVPNLDPDGVSVKTADMQKTDIDAKVTGVIANDLEENADYFAAHARFWKDDVLLSAGLDNQTDVPAGENWSFEAGYMGYDERWKDANDFDVVPEVTTY
jgi:hypothetical protein